MTPHCSCLQSALCSCTCGCFPLLLASKPWFLLQPFNLSHQHAVAKLHIIHTKYFSTPSAYSRANEEMILSSIFILRLQNMRTCNEKKGTASLLNTHYLPCRPTLVARLGRHCTATGKSFERMHAHFEHCMWGTNLNIASPIMMLLLLLQQSNSAKAENGSMLRLFLLMVHLITSICKNNRETLGSTFTRVLIHLVNVPVLYVPGERSWIPWISDSIRIHQSGWLFFSMHRSNPSHVPNFSHTNMRTQEWRGASRLMSARTHSGSMRMAFLMYNTFKVGTLEHDGLTCHESKDSAAVCRSPTANWWTVVKSHVCYIPTTWTHLNFSRRFHSLARMAKRFKFLNSRNSSSLLHFLRPKRKSKAYASGKRRGWTFLLELIFTASCTDASLSLRSSTTSFTHSRTLAWWVWKRGSPE